MKKQLALLTVLFMFLLGCSASRPASSQDQTADSQAKPNEAEAKQLRDKLLKSSPQEMGLSKQHAEAKVWGAAMEVAFPEGVATIVSLRDGSASLYSSTGFTVLGRYSIAQEARRFVVLGEKHLGSMQPTETFPYPKVGQIKFYVLTRDGVYSSEADEKELDGGQHALSPLFVAGNGVLSGLRIAAERMDPTGP
jgi:hypothetical protein